MDGLLCFIPFILEKRKKWQILGGEIEIVKSWGDLGRREKSGGGGGLWERQNREILGGVGGERNRKILGELGGTEILKSGESQISSCGGLATLM